MGRVFRISYSVDNFYLSFEESFTILAKDGDSLKVIIFGNEFTFLLLFGDNLDVYYY